VITKSIWIAMITLIFIGSSCDSYKHSSVINFRRDYTLFVANGEYDELASMFYYPASLPSTELREEQQRISGLIALLTKDLGAIDWNGDSAKGDGDTRRFAVVVSCADDDDWKGQEPPPKVLFPVTFEHAGAGFLHVEFQRLSYWSPIAAEVKYEFAEIPDGLEASLGAYDVEIMVIPTLSERLQAEFGSFYFTLDSLFRVNDPLGWFDGGNSPSYRNDLGVILYTLKSPQTKSEAELRSFLNQQFSYEIAADSASAEPVLDQLAQLIWRLWRESKGL